MRLFMLLIIALVFSACGKTGDLYLPDENAPAEKPAAKTEASTEP